MPFEVRGGDEGCFARMKVGQGLICMRSENAEAASYHHVRAARKPSNDTPVVTSGSCWTARCPRLCLLSTRDARDPEFAQNRSIMSWRLQLRRPHDEQQCCTLLTLWTPAVDNKKRHNTESLMLMIWFICRVPISCVAVVAIVVKIKHEQKPKFSSSNPSLAFCRSVDERTLYHRVRGDANTS